MGCLLFDAQAAHAHLMPTGHGTINVTDSKLYIIISLPAASFDLKGTRGEGLLNNQELEKNSASIREQLKKNLFISSGEERATFEKILLNLPSGAGPIQKGKKAEKESVEEHDEDTNMDLTMMIVAQMKNPPESISIRSGLWSTENDSIKFNTTVSEGAKTVRSELGKISASNPEYVFFAGPKYVVQTSLRNGFLHLVGGWDHFLFVLLMLIGPLLLKRWVTLMLAFASAYTLGFAAISLGWISFPVFSFVSVFWIESVILGSLVIAAIPILLRKRPSLSIEAFVVFVLGLFHGLGFASAMSGTQEYNHLVELKILGFNGGAFLGQLLIAVCVLAIYGAMDLKKASLRPDTPL